MMTIVSQKFPGLLRICDGCNILLAYDSTDVYENQFVYCPVCKTKLKVNINFEYDGVIDKNNDVRCGDE